MSRKLTFTIVTIFIFQNKKKIETLSLPRFQLSKRQRHIPQWELITSSHKSYRTFASSLQLLDPAKEG